MIDYLIKLDKVPVIHLDWIREFSEGYSDTVSCDIEPNSLFTPNSYNVLLSSTNYTVVQQMASYIINKICAVDYLERCSAKSEGEKYWVFYFIRGLRQTMRNILKKALKSITFKNTSKNS